MYSRMLGMDGGVEVVTPGLGKALRKAKYNLIK
jgi:hypothetical protein